MCQTQGGTRESFGSLCTDRLCKDNLGSWLRCLRLHLVLWPEGPGRLALMTHYRLRLDFRFRFRFSAEFSLYFRWHVRFRPNVLRHFRPKVKLPLLVDL